MPKPATFLLCTLIISLALPFSVAGATDPQTIGFIKTSQGSVTITRSEKKIPARINASIFINDILETGSDGALGITFKDNTVISIGPDTQYVIDEFAFQPQKKKLSFVSRLTRGTLHFVSGTIAKLAPKKVAVKTAAGTIGVRGTRFLVKIEPR